MNLPRPWNEVQALRPQALHPYYIAPDIQPKRPTPLPDTGIQKRMHTLEHDLEACKNIMFTLQQEIYNLRKIVEEYKQLVEDLRDEVAIATIERQYP